MKPLVHPRSRLALGLAILLLAAGTPLRAQESDPAVLERGKRLFEANCAACHGKTGLGDGPLAGMLTVAPGNLQEIALNNGGNFPFLRIVNMIDGRGEVAAHGPREMPIWGETFISNDGALEARGKLLDLTLYVASLQVI